jgi:AcrR family transcriptional regulator
MRAIQLYCSDNTIVLEPKVTGSANTNNQAMSVEDISTREQVLKAAIQQFAEHGFRGASIRGIASAAGVSPGLVQHHFGTKDGLRQACDEWVMYLLKDTQFQMLQRGAPPVDDSMVDRMNELQPVIDYMLMSLTSGSEIAAGWFREITEYTHDALTSGRIGPALDPDSQDTWAIAATQTAMALGVTAFYRNIHQALRESDEAELLLRVGRARMFLATDRILGTDTRERLAEALDRYAQSKTTGKPPPEHAPRGNSE